MMGKTSVLQSLSTSSFGMSVALHLARAVPRHAAEGIVDRLGVRFLASSASLSEACRLNQWMVSDKTLSASALDAAIHENVRMMGHFLYDFYHVLGNDRAEEQLVILDDVADVFLHQHATEGPFVYACAHFGNFDLMGRVLSRHGLTAQVLSVANPNEGYQWQNAVRSGQGLEVTPVTVEALRQATRGLAEGRSVITGLDRPLPQSDKIQPRLFGHAAPLPLLHVRLAMKAHVPVVIAAAPRTASGQYRLIASQPIEMIGGRESPDALRANAERCLAEVERMIRSDPGQWAMPHPVWPDLSFPANE